MKSKFYCVHCGNDCGPPVDKAGSGDRLCPARDGDFCAPRRRLKLPSPKPAPKVGDPGFKLPRKALEHVVDLAVYGKFDKHGEGEGLEKDDINAVLQVCAAFGIELPDSHYFPKKSKKAKKTQSA